MSIPPTKESLLAENAELRARLEESEEALRAIRSGEPSMPLQSASEAARETTKRNGSETTLRASEERLLLALEASRSIAWSWDLRSGAVLMSKNVVRAMGIPSRLDAATAVKVIHPEDAAHLAAAAERAIVERGSYTAEIRVIRPGDGSILWGRICGKVQCDAGGDPVLVIGTATDITEGKQVEQALRESEARFRSLFENALDAMFLTNPDGTIAAANPAALSMFGMSEEELYRAGRAGITNHADPRHAEALEKRARLGRLSAELTYVRKDGTIFPAEVQSAILAGAHKQAFVVLRDITERKRAERVLFESEQLHRVAFDLAPTGTVYVEPGGRFIKVNQSMCEITGYSAEELTGMTIQNLTHPDDRASDAVLLDAILEGRVQTYKNEKRYVRKDGGICWVAVTARMVNDANGFPRYGIGVIRDITDRVAAQKQLRASEEFNRTVLESSPDCFKVLDAAGALVMINEPGLRLMEIDDFAPLLGKIWWQLWPEPWRAQAETAVVRARHGEMTRFEAFCPTLKGTPKWWDVMVAPVGNGDCGVERIICVSRDITARRRAEKALGESEARFRSTFHNAATPMMVTSVDGHFLEVNGALCKMLGYLEQELLGTTFGALTHPEDHQATAIEALSHLVAREITSFRTEKRYLHKDGHIVWCDVSVSVVSHPDGSVAYFIAQAYDITVGKRAEHALIRSEQFARGQWAEAEAALEAVPANIAILNSKGVITRVNKAWTCFASENGKALGSIAVGTDYLALCDSVAGVEAGPAGSFARGIRKVFSGAFERFSMEYPCHSAEEQRWFMGYVTASRDEGLLCAVIAHVDTTAQKVIEEEIRLLNHELESRVIQRTSELQSAVSALETQIAERQRLEREILEISEREQRRLGQDLHDGLSQELAGIALLCKVLANTLDCESNASAKMAADIATYAANSIESSRRLAKGLYPVELSRNGLYLALEELARQTTERLGICCELRQNGAIPSLKQFVNIHIYRIVQECVGNAIKHGNARRIIIESLVSKGIYSFTVTDNGLGFDPPAAGTGMGLNIMNYRARVIGAQIDVRKPAEGGCKVTCQWNYVQN